MRLFRLELKRILKSRRTLILLAIALLLSVAMAYLPISFEGINRPNEDGTVTELDGLAAIKYKQDLYKTSAGEVTPDRIKSALETVSYTHLTLPTTSRVRGLSSGCIY